MPWKEKEGKEKHHLYNAVAYISVTEAALPSIQDRVTSCCQDIRSIRIKAQTRHSFPYYYCYYFHLMRG